MSHERGRQRRRRCAAAVAACFLAAGAASAQERRVGDSDEDLLRTLQVAGLRNDPNSWNVRPLRLPIESAGPTRRRGPFTVALLDPEQHTGFNSALPWGQNDGAVWQGRGFAGGLRVGGVLQAGPFTLQLRPELVYAQNQSFALTTVQDEGRFVEFANPWNRAFGVPAIDMPQRFGADGYGELRPGQSGAWVTLGGFTAGASTAEQWWGPAQRNAIVLSNHASGFLHAFAGTSRPLDVWVGHVEGRVIWGRLEGSPYFERETPRSDRYFSGFVASFAPKAVPGLSLGVTRAFVEYPPEGGLSAGDYFRAFQGVTKQTQQTPENPTGDDEADQVLSLFGRWVFPESGFEVYAEWGRNDHAQNLQDFAIQPEHSQAVTAGFQKVFGTTERRLTRVRAEITSLERTQTHEDRPTPGWYRHHLVHHGYTHRGQVLGAGVGPGGNAQWLAIDVIRTWGRVGGFALRETTDNDTYYRLREAGELTLRRNDVTAGGGVFGALTVGSMELVGDIALLRRLNRDYASGANQTNLHVGLYTRWRLGP